ncbi:putative bis(5'-nucleosyl)-tetraphosphatase (asymmetrical) [Helianthus anomalus]
MISRHMLGKSLIVNGVLTGKVKHKSGEFLFKFTGKDEEINLLGDGTEKPEFGEWSWMSPEQVVDRAVDFKKPVYKEVMDVFSPHLE